MANDRLRAALQSAGLGPDDLANIVEVDVRTVRRWLSGGTPYPRQQGKVARALDVAEHDLWPQTATTQPRPPAAESDRVVAYTAANDPAAPDWHALVSDATGRIDLLGDTLAEALATPGVSAVLAAKASEGCAVRILIYDTDENLAPLLNRAGIEIRVLRDPAGYLIHRFDDDLLLTLHLIGADADQAPVIHLRRAGAGGPFDRLVAYYDDLWSKDSEPLGTSIQAAGEKRDDREDADTAARHDGPDRPEAGTSEPSPLPAPRRWPGREPGARTHG